MSGVLPWGDQGNGYYRNPVLNADFSDPDIVRVGADYYLVCSDFHFMGIPVLHSRDLVNWSYVGRVYDRLDIHPGYDAMDRYGKGSWAPSITWHAGVFHVYFCTPDEGLFHYTATDPAGPWTGHTVAAVPMWEDPCPFWDEDGQAYLGHSLVGAGPIIVHKMSPDGNRLLDDGQIVYVGKIAEGTKFYKRDGWYYLVIPEGGVERGWQAVLRSKNLYGPYERRVVLKTGRTVVNGPHQGSLVDDPDGRTWFFHFQSAGLLGRVCHLQPVTWSDGWPVMGIDDEPVELWSKPVEGQAPSLSATADDFSGPALGWQWQFNHNPVDAAWSLTQRPGWLRLKALGATSLLTARNTLTQKLLGPRGRVQVELDGSALGEGQVAGLCFIGGNKENWIALRWVAGRRVVTVRTGETWAHGPLCPDQPVLLGARIDLAGVSTFEVNLGRGWLPLGGPCDLAAGYWKGLRTGLFTFDGTGGLTPADFRNFDYQVEP